MLDDYLYYYRVNKKNSTTVRKYDELMDVVDVFKLVREEFIKTNNYDNEYKKFLFRVCPLNRFLILKNKKGWNYFSMWNVVSIYTWNFTLTLILLKL